MYRSVPPHGYQDSSQSNEDAHKTSSEKGYQETSESPANISQEMWERFQKLKSRRMESCSRGRAQRVNALRKKALDNVNKELTEQDKELLIEDGVTLPAAPRKRKRPKSHEYSSVMMPSSSSSSETPDKSSGQVEKKWQELKKYLDPNPQFKGCDDGMLAQKSGLERALDTAVDRRELEQAVAISDSMATRELASKIATAFDCVEYVKKQKIKEEGKRKKKPSKLKWSFEQKKRWETKGNM